MPTSTYINDLRWTNKNRNREDVNMSSTIGPKPGSYRDLRRSVILQQTNDTAAYDPFKPYVAFIQAMVIGSLKQVLGIETYTSGENEMHERHVALEWLKSAEEEGFLEVIGITMADIEHALSDPDRLKGLIAPKYTGPAAEAKRRRERERKREQRAKVREAAAQDAQLAPQADECSQ